MKNVDEELIDALQFIENVWITLILVFPPNQFVSNFVRGRFVVLRKLGS